MWIKLLRSISAPVVGYAVILLCTIEGFKPLGNFIHVNAPLHIHLAGAMVAVISGVLGGLAAAFIAGRYPVRHASAVLIFLFIDTATVLSRGSPDPVWFELVGAATLMGATVVGGVLYGIVGSRRKRTHPAVG